MTTPAAGRGARRIVAVYPYLDESGTLLYEVVRFEPKGFAQRRPNGNGSHVWGLNGVRRVLYRLPELLAAPLDATVFIAEGEKDTDRLRSLGLIATTSGAAGSWRPEFAEYFKSRDVVVLPDNDGRGLVHTDDVAPSLHHVARRVRLVWLPGPEKSDVSDWLDAGHTVEELLAIIERTPEYSPPTPETISSSGGSPSKAERKSAAERLVEALPGDTELFHTPDGTEYATVDIDSHRETHRIKSTTFRQYLRRLLYLEERKAPSASAVHDAVELIAARARFDGHEQQVFLRTGPRIGGGLWIDLCDPTWSAIEVTASGWRVVEHPEIRFRRAPGMLNLPVPKCGGSLADLGLLLNVRSTEDMVLVLTWITAAMRPRGPFPVLAVHGEHGSCKSTAAKVIRSFVDPSTAPLSSVPTDEHNLVIAARNSWVVCLDNLSRLDGWLSDALCRLATGGGLRTRTLYTDTEETIFDAQRPIILNGIEAVATRGDLVDRSLTIFLEPVAPEYRREEREFWAAFEEARPRILSALLDAVVGGLHQQAAGVELDRKPRMADFAVWGTAVEQPLGFAPGAFMASYTKNREDSNAQALESSPVATAIVGMMSATATWTGTAGELLEKLTQLAGAATKEKSWPGSPRALRGILERLSPNLRETGVDVAFLPRENKRRPIQILRREHAQDNVTTVTSSGDDLLPGDDGPHAIERPSPQPSLVSASKHESRDGGDGQNQLLSVPAVAKKPGPITLEEDF